MTLPGIGLHVTLKGVERIPIRVGGSIHGVRLKLRTVNVVCLVRSVRKKKRTKS